MFQLTFFFLSSVLAADSQVGDVWADMPPSISIKQFPARRLRSRRLAKEDFEKTSGNFFDFSPNCEQKGDRYCDGSHFLGGGNEFASWFERTQHVYTNMARMDFSAFAKAPYNAVYDCTPKHGLKPFY